MDLLINQNKPEDQQDYKLYYVRDEQWTKLTAKDIGQLWSMQSLNKEAHQGP